MSISTRPGGSVRRDRSARRPDCDLWNHVYHPARLVFIHSCVRVTGTISLERPEPDGGVHIRLMVDPMFRALLNTRNRKAQKGALVLEPICVGPVTQSDAIQPRSGFRNSVTIAPTGSHVAVTGSCVDDAEPGHG